MRINKKFFRSLLVIVLLVYAFLVIILVTGNVEALEWFQERHLTVRFALAAMGILAGSSAVYIWISMILHCYKHFLGSQHAKWAWLTIILITNVLGALLYYLATIEFGEEEKE